MVKLASFRDYDVWTRGLLLSFVGLLLTACPAHEPNRDPPIIDGGGSDGLRGGKCTQREIANRDPKCFRGGEADYAEFSIFWATDRRQTQDTDPKTMFAGDRGADSLVYGTSKISVPNDHKVGEIEGPGFWRFILGKPKDPKKHMVVLPGETDVLEEDPWFEKVRDRAAGGERTAFVFIHGYNTTFEDAALRTAQIGYDLKFSGASILYSWPSKGMFWTYTTDEENARWSVSHLVEFLKDIRIRAEADEVTLIAHSMGARLLGDALKALGKSTFADGTPPFNEIILSAPDIDADIFKKQIMPVMRDLARGRTLYVSSEDSLLKSAGSFLRGGLPRAGDSGDQIVVMDDLDTIDATEVRTDFWRHADVSNRPVLTDMYALIRDGKRARERQYLQEQETKDGVFWRLPP